MLFLPNSALKRFRSQGVSGPDIPLVRCHMPLEVPLWLVLGSSGIVHSVFFLKLVQGLKVILNFHSISLSYGMAGAKTMPVETGTFGSCFPIGSQTEA